MTPLSTHAARIERAQRMLAATHIDWLICGPGADLQYFTGLRGHDSERLSVLMLPSSGRPAWVVPVLEAPLLDDLGDLVTVHRWEEADDPAAAAAAVMGGGAPVVALTESLRAAFVLRLQKALPGASWIEATPTLRPLRMVKDAQEIALLEEAAHLTDEAWVRFLETSIIGLTEREAMRRLVEITTSMGLGPGFCHAGSGPYSASPHYGGGDRVIGPNEAVVFDWGGTLEGYNSDVTRTVWTGGAPDPEFARIYQTVLEANEATLAAAGPGVPCETLDRTARDLITAAGYGEYFVHRVGHGLGLSLHEEPYLVAGNTLPLQAGMVFSDEPGIYLPGRFGARIEDTVVCTDTGARKINHAPRDLRVMQ
ncbi:MAG: M24 family metallopeptidase [Thermomicrobiales bacterium]